MEIIGKQSTKSKSYSTQRQEINEIICYAAARNKRSHMIPSVKKSTKSFDMELQEINEVIRHVPGEHDALAAGTSTDVPAAA